MGDVPPASISETLIAELAAELGVTQVEARAYLDELVRFFEVGAQSEEPLAPSAPIDVAWHQLLRHPDVYESFCVERFGKIIPHVEESDPSVLAPWYDRTTRLMSLRFGALDPKMWPAGAPAGCGLAGDEPAPPPPPPN